MRRIGQREQEGRQLAARPAPAWLSPAIDVNYWFRSVMTSGMRISPTVMTACSGRAEAGNDVAVNARDGDAKRSHAGKAVPSICVTLTSAPFAAPGIACAGNANRK